MYCIGNAILKINMLLLFTGNLTLIKLLIPSQCPLNWMKIVLEGISGSCNI